jgi:type IV pilus assembly protein PilM
MLDAEALKAEIQTVLIEVEKVISFYQYSVLKGEITIEKMLVSGDMVAMNVIVEECALFFQSMKVISQLEFTDTYVPARYYDALGLMLRKEVR